MEPVHENSGLPSDVHQGREPPPKLASVSSTSGVADGAVSLWSQVAAQDGRWQPTATANSADLDVLIDLQNQVEHAKNECVNKRWRYTRKSGEVIIFRDLFDKMAKWIDLFKQVGDAAVQYDPVHAALPWAGVRFLLQVAVSDINSFAFVIEDTEMISETITRCAVFEHVYLLRDVSSSFALRQSLVKLYGGIILYLLEAKQFFEQNSFKRMLKSAVIGVETLGRISKMIKEQASNLDWWSSISDAEHNALKISGLRAVVEGLDEPMRRINNAVETIEDRLERKERIDIWNWLSSQPYKLYHAQTRKGILDGTGAWLLGDPIFRRWRMDSASSMLWLHGIPGSGKSKIVSIVVDQMLEDCRLGYNPMPAYYYCSRNTTEPGRSDPDAILASIVRQLSSPTGRAILPPVLNLYRKREEEGFVSGPLSTDESISLILELCRYHPQLTIIIDAIDECHFEKRAALLEALEIILQKSLGMIKIFVSSRDDHDIVCHLQDYPDLQVSSRKNMMDIRSFIRAETGSLIAKGKLLRYVEDKDTLRAEVVKKLSLGATGMFRWASLQLEYLCTLTTAEAVRERLGRPPPKLTELYQELYSRIQNFQQDDLRAATNTLKWLLCAKRPLKSAQFLAAITFNPRGHFSEITTDSILNLCSNFIVLDTAQDVFRFAHLSVREYLETRPEYTNELSNSLAAESCLCRLLDASCEDVSQHLSQTNLVLDTKQPFYSYAMLFWAKHIQDAGPMRLMQPLERLLSSFLLPDLRGGPTPAFSLWMYCISAISGFSPQRLGSKLMDCRCRSNTPLFVCCAYGFDEFVQRIVENTSRGPQTVYNNSEKSSLEVAICYGNFRVIRILISHAREVTESAIEAAAGSANIAVMKLFFQSSIPLTVSTEAVEIAVGNPWIGKELIPLLLSAAGEIDVTSRMLWAALGNSFSGSQNLTLLLSQPKIQRIPNQVVVAAVSNRKFASELTRILLACQHKVVVTEEVLMAAARNIQHGPDILSLLVSSFGKEILPDIVLSAGLDYSDGADLAVLLLVSEHRDVPRLWEVPSIALDFTEAWECNMNSEFQRFKAHRDLKPIAVSPAAPGRLSPAFADELSNRRSWMLHGELAALFAEEMESLMVSVSERRKEVLKLPKPSFRHDIQGIDWRYLGIARSDIREFRNSTYQDYWNLAPYMNLSPAPPLLVNEDDFFRFDRTFLAPVSIGHFQLRNNIACATNYEVYGIASRPGHYFNIAQPELLVSAVSSSESFSTTMTALAASESVIVSGGMDGNFAVHRLAEGPQSHIHGLISSKSKNIINFIMLPDEGHASFASNDGYVKDLNYERNTLTEKCQFDFAVNCHDRSPDGRLQVVVCDDPQVFICDVDSGKTMFSLQGHRDYGFACAWSDDGRHVATGNQDSTVKIWDARMWTSRKNGVETAHPLHTIGSDVGCVRSLQFSPTGGGKKVLLAAESADIVSIIDADTFQSRQIIDCFGEISGARLSHDGQDIFVAVTDDVSGGVLKYSR